MFKGLRAIEKKNLNHSGRSYVGETLQLEGDLRTAGSLDVAGLINGLRPHYSKNYCNWQPIKEQFFKTVLLWFCFSFFYLCFS